jgi:hypothetical protein
MTDGLDDLGDGPYLEGPERFIDSLSHDATRSDVGGFMTKQRMLLYTVNRFDYTADRRGGATLEARCRVFAMPNPDFIVDPTPDSGTQVAQAHEGIFTHRRLPTPHHPLGVHPPNRPTPPQPSVALPVGWRRAGRVRSRWKAHADTSDHLGRRPYRHPSVAG